MNLPRIVVLFCFAACAGLAHAVELVPGLAYLRPGDEPVAQTGSVVIDLRSVTDESAAAPLLAAVEPGATNKRRVVLVLVSPQTPEGLRRRASVLPRAMTIGRQEPDFTPDIVVTASAEADQRAIQALADGTAPGKLLADNIDKPRYDEASLVRDHAARDDERFANDESTTETSPVETPIGDPVLRRAVHIFQGLSVLKRI